MGKKELTKQFEKLPIEKKELIFLAAVDYELLNQQEKLLKARRDKQCRPVVEIAAEQWGIPDGEGHLRLKFVGKREENEEEIEVEIVRQKKVSRTLNSVAAEELLKEKGIYDTCVAEVVTYEIDEEKLIEAYEAGIISAAELDSIFTERINYATIVNVDCEEIQAITTARKAIEKGKQKGDMPTIES